jgi:hypothetical protein
VAASVDWTAIGEACGGAIVAGTAITLAFATGVRGLIRAEELRGEGRDLVAGLWAALGAAGLLVAIAATMIGLVLVVSSPPSG